ncbi:MAG: hypothetical protein GY845_28910 [Planctomycetes bacterium]|nr:hypothetical protein [Planctomycetota bacterium]
MRTIFLNRVLLIAIVTLVLCAPISAGCSSGDDETTNEDFIQDTTPTGDDAPASELSITDGDATDAINMPPLELTPDLCDDSNNMALLMNSLGSDGSSPSYGKLNQEQAMRMVTAPTEGPFYMVNLVRFRNEAEYPDGRETDLTGREANALYSPIEFLDAIGARIVFVGEVDGTTVGEENEWNEVAIVEYPCPLALFAMSAHPEFQARSVHKNASLEVSTVMVTHLQTLRDIEPTETPFPTTTDDPAFQLVQVIRYHDQAQYDIGSNEPSRTGREAMDLYTSSVREAELRLGVYPIARFTVQGVFIGDGRAWDEIWIDHVPSNAVFEALSADPDVIAAQHHREAALEDAYGLVTSPMISSIPNTPGR